jgi:hypothetical protein
VKARIRRQMDIDNHHTDPLGAKASLNGFGLFGRCRGFGFIAMMAENLLKHISYTRIIIN